MPDRPQAGIPRPPDMVPLKASEWLSALFRIGLVALGGWYLYHTVYTNLFSPNDPPAVLTSDALNETQLDDIIATSAANELRFKSEFAGKQFVASGSFAEANKDFRYYHIRVSVDSKSVACETNDPKTLGVVATLSVGDSVKIYGVIDTTWMGDLVLKSCALVR